MPIIAGENVANNLGAINDALDRLRKKKSAPTNPNREGESVRGRPNRPTGSPHDATNNPPSGGDGATNPNREGESVRGRPNRPTGSPHDATNNPPSGGDGATNPNREGESVRGRPNRPTGSPRDGVTNPNREGESVRGSPTPRDGVTNPNREGESVRGRPTSRDAPTNPNREGGIIDGDGGQGAYDDWLGSKPDGSSIEDLNKWLNKSPGLPGDAANNPLGGVLGEGGVLDGAAETLKDGSVKGDVKGDGLSIVSDEEDDDSKKNPYSHLPDGEYIIDGNLVYISSYRSSYGPDGRTYQVYALENPDATDPSDPGYKTLAQTITERDGGGGITTKDYFGDESIENRRRINELHGRRGSLTDEEQLELDQRWQQNRQFSRLGDQIQAQSYDSPETRQLKEMAVNIELAGAALDASTSFADRAAFTRQQTEMRKLIDGLSTKAAREQYHAEYDEVLGADFGDWNRANIDHRHSVSAAEADAELGNALQRFFAAGQAIPLGTNSTPEYQAARQELLRALNAIPGENERANARAQVVPILQQWQGSAFVRSNIAEGRLDDEALTALQGGAESNEAGFAEIQAKINSGEYSESDANVLRRRIEESQRASASAISEYERRVANQTDSGEYNAADFASVGPVRVDHPLLSDRAETQLFGGVDAPEDDSLGDGVVLNAPDDDGPDGAGDGDITYTTADGDTITKDEYETRFREYTGQEPTDDGEANNALWDATTERHRVISGWADEGVALVNQIGQESFNRQGGETGLDLDIAPGEMRARFGDTGGAIDITQDPRYQKWLERQPEGATDLLTKEGEPFIAAINGSVSDIYEGEKGYLDTHQNVVQLQGDIKGLLRDLEREATDGDPLIDEDVRVNEITERMKEAGYGADAMSNVRLYSQRLRYQTADPSMPLPEDLLGASVAESDRAVEVGADGRQAMREKQVDAYLEAAGTAPEIYRDLTLAQKHTLAGITNSNQKGEDEEQVDAYLKATGTAPEIYADLTLAQKHTLAGITNSNQNREEEKQVDAYLKATGTAPEIYADLTLAQKHTLAGITNSNQNREEEKQVDAYLEATGTAPEIYLTLAQKHTLAGITNSNQKGEEEEQVDDYSNQNREEETEADTRPLSIIESELPSDNRVLAPDGGRNLIMFDPNQPFKAEEFAEALDDARFNDDPATAAKLVAYFESYGPGEYDAPGGGTFTTNRFLGRSTDNDKDFEENKKPIYYLALAAAAGVAAPAYFAKNLVGGAIGGTIGAGVAPIVPTGPDEGFLGLYGTGDEGWFEFTGDDPQRGWEGFGSGAVAGTGGQRGGKVARSIGGKYLPKVPKNWFGRVGTDVVGGAGFDTSFALLPDDKGKINITKQELIGDIGFGAVASPAIEVGRVGYSNVVQPTAVTATRALTPTKVTLPGGREVPLLGGFVPQATAHGSIPKLKVSQGAAGEAISADVIEQLSRTGQYQEVIGSTAVKYNPSRFAEAYHAANPDKPLYFSNTPFAEAISEGPVVWEKHKGYAEDNFFVQAGDATDKFSLQTAAGVKGKDSGIFVYSGKDGLITRVVEADGTVKYYKGGYEIEGGIRSLEQIPASERVSAGGIVGGDIYADLDVEAPSFRQRWDANVQAIGDVVTLRSKNAGTFSYSVDKSQDVSALRSWLEGNYGRNDGLSDGDSGQIDIPPAVRESIEKRIADAQAEATAGLNDVDVDPNVRDARMDEATQRTIDDIVAEQALINKGIEGHVDVDRMFQNAQGSPAHAGIDPERAYVPNARLGSPMGAESQLQMDTSRVATEEDPSGLEPGRAAAGRAVAVRAAAGRAAAVRVEMQSRFRGRGLARGVSEEGPFRSQLARSDESPFRADPVRGEDYDPLRPPPGEGDYDPLRPPPGEGDYDPLRPPPGEGDYDPLRPPPGEGDYDPLRPPPGEGDYDPLRPPPGEGDYDPLRPPPGEGDYDPLRPPPGEGDDPLRPPPPGEGDDPLRPPPPGEGDDPLRPPPPGEGDDPLRPPPPDDRLRPLPSRFDVTRGGEPTPGEIELRRSRVRRPGDPDEEPPSTVRLVVPPGKYPKMVTWETEVQHQLDTETGRHITSVIAPTNLHTARISETQDTPINQTSPLVAGNLRVVPKAGAIEITSLAVRDRIAKGATEEGDVVVDEALVAGRRKNPRVEPNENSIVMQTAPGKGGNPRRKPSAKKRRDEPEEDGPAEITLILNEH